MKTNILKTTLMAIMLLFCMVANAEVLQFEINGICYRYTTTDEQGNKCVSVVNPDHKQLPLSDGELIIPDCVNYNNEVYCVTAVFNLCHQNELIRFVAPLHCDEIDLYSCPKLEYVDLRDITKVNFMCLLPSLRELRFSNEHNISIQLGDFCDVGLEEFIAPRMTLDRFAFSHWPNIKTLDLSNIVSFEMKVFDNFPKLETLTMPRVISSSTCCDDCFTRLPSLKVVTMPEEIEDEDHLFADCLNDCKNLSTVYCPSPTPYNLMILLNRDELPEPAGCVSAQRGNRTDDIEPDIILFDIFKYKYTNIGGEDFDKSQCTVYVPVGCVEAYRNHPSWKDFPNIYEYDFSALTEIRQSEDHNVTVVGSEVVVPSGMPFKVYDISGRLCNPTGLNRGIYIVVLEDGYAKKVSIP